MPEGQWFAVYTNPNCEGRAKQSLELGHGFVVFWPVERRFAAGPNRRVIETSLFTRYMFAYAAPGQDPHRMRGCDGVQTVLGTNGRLRPVPGDLIETLMGQENAGLFDFTKPRPKLSAGDMALIDKGPFRGFTGKILKVGSGSRVDLLLSAIGFLDGRRVNVAVEDVVAA